MKNKNGFSPLIIIVLVALIVAGFFYYAFYNTIIPPADLETGIYGKVISDSDVQTFPDTAIANSLIFTIPSSEFEGFYSGSEGIVDDRLQTSFAKYVMTDTLGNYQSALEPNTYTLCFTIDQTENNKHKIADCVEIEILKNELQKVNISRQFDNQFSCVTENTCTKIELPQLETLNWKTYTNINLGFTVKLPVDIVLINELESRVEFGTFPPTKTPYLIISSSISYTPKTQNKKTEIDGLTFNEYALSNNERVFQSRDYPLEIQWNPQFNDVDLLPKILSTFEFTNDQNSWETYTSTVSLFSIKLYPSLEFINEYEILDEPSLSPTATIFTAPEVTLRIKSWSSFPEIIWGEDYTIKDYAYESATKLNELGSYIPVLSETEIDHVKAYEITNYFDTKGDRNIFVYVTSTNKNYELNCQINTQNEVEGIAICNQTLATIKFVD